MHVHINIVTLNKILIADAGSTKISWAYRDLLCPGNSAVLTTGGFNPLLACDAELSERLGAIRPLLPGAVDAVWFYGAGCATAQVCAKVSEVLGRLAGTDRVEVESDLLGATRGLLGDTPGVACILGTGSNSCEYDGEKTVGHTPSLGYALGDEGSGNALGRRVVTDALKGVMPQSLATRIMSQYNLSAEQAIEAVYRRPQPGRWLASFAPVLSATIEDPSATEQERRYAEAVVFEELGRFADRNLMHYSRQALRNVCFAGSVAVAFEPQLRRAMQERGIRVEKVVKSPLEGLVQYHESHLKA